MGDRLIVGIVATGATGVIEVARTSVGSTIGNVGPARPSSTGHTTDGGGPSKIGHRPVGGESKRKATRGGSHRPGRGRTCKCADQGGARRGPVVNVQVV